MVTASSARSVATEHRPLAQAGHPTWLGYVEFPNGSTEDTQNRCAK